MDDDIDEGASESVTVSGTTTVGLTPSAATLSITDNDAAPTGITLSVSPGSISESASSAQTISVTATLTGDTTRATATVVSVDVRGGTATEVTDYTIAADSKDFDITIAAGQSSKSESFDLTPVDDDIDEGASESVTVSGTTTVGLTPSAATLTITDDDDAPTGITLSVSPGSISESAGSAQSIEVTATLDGSTTRSTATVVSVDVRGGTATEGTDYTIAAGSKDFDITIAAGQSSKSESFDLTPVDDDIDEGASESVTVSGTTTVGLTPSAAALTITDDDDAPTGITLSVSPGSISESAGSAQSIEVTATLDGSTTRSTATVVSVDVRGGTATEGDDYTIAAGSKDFDITIAAGQSSKSESFDLTPVDDDIDEGASESVTVSGTTTVGLTPSAAALTITDDDTAPSDITLTVDTTTIAESSGETTVRVTAALEGSKTLPTDTTVSISLGESGTADEDDDFTAVLSNVTIIATQSSGWTDIAITPVHDSLVEGDETLVVEGDAGDLDVAPATITLEDDVPGTTNNRAAVSISGPTDVSEGDTATFNVSLSTAVAQAVTVDWSVTNTDTSTTDHNGSAGGSVTFSAGDNENQTITITITDDMLSEGDEDFSVELDSVDAGDLSNLVELGTATTVDVTIGESDPLTVNIAGPASAVAEGGKATFTISLSPTGVMPGDDLTVNYATADGTAVKVSDYTEKTGSVSFTAGQTPEDQTVEVDTSQDDVAEGAESFSLTISSLSGGGGNTGEGTDGSATIDDSADTATVTLARKTTGNVNEGDDVEFTVALSRQVAGEVTVAWTAEVGTGSAEAADFSATTDPVVFAANATEAQTISVNVTQDMLSEGEETFSVKLTGVTVDTSLAGLVTASTTPVSVTIGKSDALTVNIAGPTAAVAEGSKATFTISLSPTGVMPGDELTVNYATADGTAKAASDYTEKTGSVSFTAGQTPEDQTVEVDTSQDDVAEGDESFSLAISSLSGGGGNTGEGTDGTATIDDSADAAPTDITLSVDTTTIAESSGETTVRVTAALEGSKTLPTDTTVSISLGESGTADEGDDFTAVLADVTIIGGQSSGWTDIAITPVHDSLVEGDETIVVEGDAGDLDVAPATITLEDNVPGTTNNRATVSISGPADVSEGDTATFNVSLSHSVAAEVTVVWSVTGGTATADDYGTASGTVTFDAGEGEDQTIGIDITDDDISEGAETFSVVLDSVDAGDLSNLVELGSDTEVEVTITDNDAAPTGITLSVSPGSISESAGSAQTISVTATLTGDTTRATATVVSVDVRGGTATEGDDYTIAADSKDFDITIAAGQSSKSESFDLTPVDDEIDEGASESVTVSGTTTVGLNVTGDDVAIADDDGPPTGVTLTASPDTVSEGAGATTVSVTATLTGGTTRSEDTVVSVSVSPDSAVAADFNHPVAGFDITIAAGQNSKSEIFTLTPVDDDIDETGAESVRVSGTTTLSLSVTGDDVAITDDDDAPTGITLSVSPGSISESAGSAQSIEVTATLTGDTTRATATVVSVDVRGGTATEVTDYTIAAGSKDFDITIAAGQSSKSESFELTPVDDDIDEGASESVTVSGTTTVGLTPSAATLTITDDDAAPTGITLSVSPIAISESAGSAQSIEVTATLTGDTTWAEDTVVSVDVRGGTATEGTDYTIEAASKDFDITIAAGQSSKSESFELTPVDDDIDEGASESVTVSGTTTVGLTPSAAELTITDDDAAPTGITLSVSPSTVGESDGETDITVTATLDGTTTRATATVVAVDVRGGTATEGTDYAIASGAKDFDITIPAGQSSKSESFELTPVDDDIDEGASETVTVSGTTTVGLTPSDATLTITDDDAAPTGITLSVSPSSFSESGGETDVTITATLVGGTTLPESTTVTLSLDASSTATANDDFTGALANVVIAPAESSGQVVLTLTPVDDAIVEGDESIVIAGEISGLDPDTATITITDDDTATVTLSGPTDMVSEGDAVSFTVTLSHSVAAEVGVAWSVTTGTAAAADYGTASGTVTFDADSAAGAEETFSVSVTDDTLSEGEETFVVSLGAVTQHAVGRGDGG